MFEAETVLILIALASAIVGTLWNARRLGKAIIIVLVVATAGTAVFESQKKAGEKNEAEREAAVAKRNVELILRAVQPPKIFDQAVLNGFRDVAKRNNLFVSGQNVREDGSRIFKFKRPAGNDKIAGLVFLDVAQRQQMFLHFAKGSDLIPAIQNILYGKWGNDDLATDWNIFAISTYEIAKDALDDFTPKGTEFTGNLNPSAKTITVDATLPNGQYVGNVVFSADFMAALSGVPPVERGRLIHEKTLAQIKR